MSERTKELNIRFLAGEIDAEINMAANFHDVPGIDTEAISRLRKNEFEGFIALGDLMMSVLARHCGEKLVNCDEMPVDPLPDKKIERFGEDDDGDGPDDD